MAKSGVPRVYGAEYQNPQNWPPGDFCDTKLSRRTSHISKNSGEIMSAVIAPIFPCQPVFSYFAFSRVIWTFNYITKILSLYHLFSTLLGEAIGIKQG